MNVVEFHRWVAAEHAVAKPRQGRYPLNQVFPMTLPYLP